MTACVAGGIAGSKLFHFDLHAAAPGEKTILGGLTGGILALFLTSRFLAFQRPASQVLAPSAMLGFAIGRVKVGTFSLGTVVGTLFAGVLIGQLDIKVPALVKTVFFDLFLFTTGYKVGPQFFRGLKKDALSQMALTAVLCVTCLLTAFVAAKLFNYDIGTAAGLLAGAFTESTVIGTAGDATSA